MVNYGKISMENKKGARFDISSDTDPQMIFVPSQGNISVSLIVDFVRFESDPQDLYRCCVCQQVYELETGVKRATLLGHYNTVTSCVYSDNYQTLYSGANDRNILVWSSESESCLAEASSEKIATSKCRTSLIPRRNATEDAWSSDEG